MSDKASYTMKDIARELGISVATVSRALQNSPHISKERREMIQQYAREHNYYPNVIAETLRHSKVTPMKVIGVIIPQFVHYYFSCILAGIEEVTSACGYRILIAQSDEKYEKEVEICRSFEKNKVCGIIVSQAKDTLVYNHFQQLIDHGIPLVFYDRICTGVSTSLVVVDDYAGSYAAVSHLIETGCRRIAFYGSTMNLQISQNRYNGYKDALLKHGLPLDERLCRFCDNRTDAELITPELLEMEDRPDGFFAINDDTALGILYMAKKMGFKIPEQISICGFTNGVRAISCDPMLTTVEQRGFNVGVEAARILIGHVEGSIPAGKTVKKIVRTRLIVRGTTR
jgi:DNA-binding LacI/PurR family transcriptional regulator